jgi:hypothetical protein
MCALQALAKLLREACPADSLHSKGGVPQLGAIVALHFHAILCHPQKVVQAWDVPAQQVKQPVSTAIARHLN